MHNSEIIFIFVEGIVRGDVADMGVCLMRGKPILYLSITVMKYIGYQHLVPEITMPLHLTEVNRIH